MIGKLKLGKLVHNLLEVQKEINKLLFSEFHYDSYLQNDFSTMSLVFKIKERELKDKYNTAELSEDCTKILEYLNNNPKLEYRVYKKYGMWSYDINFKK